MENQAISLMRKLIDCHVKWGNLNIDELAHILNEQNGTAEELADMQAHLEARLYLDSL